MSKHFLFLSLIGVMLFVLSIAGQDRPAFATKMTGISIPDPSPLSDRSPASTARALEIEPVLPGVD